jgi:uncharacterized protein (TIGR03083 family)
VISAGTWAVDGADIVAARVVASRTEAASATRPAIVGIAGAVSVGKSTFAAEVGAALERRGLRVEIVSTDGFLLPNATLVERGLLGRKGFPESYDVRALRDALDALRAGHAEVRIPVYSHEIYDLLPGGAHTISNVDVVVLEGVNALGAAPDLLDVAVYLDATEEDLEHWYVTRFVALVDAARDDPSSFYASMVHLGPAELERVARSTWTTINLVNLREHIAVTRAFAHLVMVKGPDHQIIEVREHAPVTADAALVEQLDQVWSSMSELGGWLTEEEWNRPTEVPGWSVQDNLAHIAGIEASLLGWSAPDHEVPDDLPHVKNDVGRRNEVFVDSRRARTGEAVLAEFREITGQRLEQLGDYDEAAFGEESWTPVGPGTVRDLLPFRVFDSWVHEQDMRRAVGRPGDLDTRVAAVVLERIAGSMPFVVGKKAAAPDGSTVVFQLDGPLARSIPIGVEGGRARLLEDTPPSPTTRIHTDTETFARLACGRLDPTAELQSGRVRVDGDDELGRSVVENMNFLF